MSFQETIRTMDKRLRLLLLAAILLLVPTIGQFISIRDLNTAGHASELALLFATAGIFLIPTGLILTGVTLAVIRRQWREHRPLVTLGALNTVIAINLTWFFFHPCSWAHVFGLTLKTCSL